MAMSCLHAQEGFTVVRRIGEPERRVPAIKCGLKLEGPAKRREVHQALLAQRLAGSIVNDLCPLAEAGRFSECPFDVA